jgi:hypothetical protein
VWIVSASDIITKARMPLQREHIQFAVLFFSVPLQYLVVQHMGSSETSRTYAISQMIEDLNKLQSRWFRIEPWKRWCHSVLLSITENAGLSSRPHDPTNTVFDPNDELGESPALEVMKYRENQQFFGQSTIVRYPKSPHIKFRVGQVVKHKKWGYRGVIIAWDETAKAPEECCGKCTRKINNGDINPIIVYLWIQEIVRHPKCHMYLRITLK